MKLDPRLAEILERQPQKEQTLAEQRAQQNDFAASLRGKLTPEIPDSLELEDR
ncbi:MAG: alpha/beta hydrolase, partial [Cutibacterium avidum]|nr:alpha/beta hydrolase [Cutibacterium avidum]